MALHTHGRHALLHRDGVHGRLRGTRRARLAAITSGGAIPDSTQYRVLLEPEGTVVGTVDEDFAIESSAGDVFQLGNASWRVLRVERGVVRVADAQGATSSRWGVARVSLWTDYSSRSRPRPCSRVVDKRRSLSSSARTETKGTSSPRSRTGSTGSGLPKTLPKPHSLARSSISTRVRSRGAWIAPRFTRT